jgi:hypothetical protein
MRERWLFCRRVGLIGFVAFAAIVVLLRAAAWPPGWGTRVAQAALEPYAAASLSLAVLSWGMTSTRLGVRIVAATLALVPAGLVGILATIVT